MLSETFVVCFYGIKVSRVVSILFSASLRDLMNISVLKTLLIIHQVGCFIFFYSACLVSVGTEDHVIKKSA